MFVANLRIVKATCACTTMGCLIPISCLSIWGCSSLHSIIKVFQDIRSFSFHYVSGYLPLCTSSLKITLHGLHHIDHSGAVFTCSNMMLRRSPSRFKTQGKIVICDKYSYLYIHLLHSKILLSAYLFNRMFSLILLSRSCFRCSRAQLHN